MYGELSDMLTGQRFIIAMKIKLYVSSSAVYININMQPSSSI